MKTSFDGTQQWHHLSAHSSGGIYFNSIVGFYTKAFFLLVPTYPLVEFLLMGEALRPSLEECTITEGNGQVPL